MQAPPSILVYGYGNPGREDDGLGIALANRIEADGIGAIAVEINYQLNVEDALTMADHELVIFADASVGEIGTFRFSRVKPETIFTYTTHAMSPGAIVALCEDLYNRSPITCLLEIKGLSFSMNERLSHTARRNLEDAYAFLKDLLSGPSPVQTAARYAGYSESVYAKGCFYAKESIGDR